MTVQQTYNEKEVLARISQGNEQEFRYLFDLYRDRLYHFINGFIHAEEVAEELVMDVFLKIWTGRELLTQIDNFNAFLYRVARNKTIDFFRASAKDTKLREALMQRLNIQDGTSADQLLMVKEYEELLRKAISLLTMQRRQAWLLSRYQQLSHEEIAQQMNISRATVNSHISEAQRFIRRYLSQSLDLALVLVLFHNK